MERAKIITRTIFKTVQAAVDMKQIITAGNFVYYIIQEVRRGNLKLTFKPNNFFL